MRARARWPRPSARARLPRAPCVCFGSGAPAIRGASRWEARGGGSVRTGPGGCPPRAPRRAHTHSAAVFAPGPRLSALAGGSRPRPVPAAAPGGCGARTRLPTRACFDPCAQRPLLLEARVVSICRWSLRACHSRELALPLSHANMSNLSSLCTAMRTSHMLSCPCSSRISRRRSCAWWVGFAPLVHTCCNPCVRPRCL
ncbi:MAG: hypothetical protein J3K34DRAFT_524449 [Monoraphidium minutum]|nr:MAG: hypothetical protein J3K34DRAFT_524449 [Monoraphidium minutum]